MQKLKMSFFHLLESLFTCFLKDKTLHNHWDYAGFTVPYYNIPSNNRELQLPSQRNTALSDYNIPSNNRELQPLLRYLNHNFIITYQVITGNYSYNVLWESSDNILKKYKWKRKSLAITPSDVNIFSQTSETLNGTAFKNIISCAKAAHDRHSPFAECINAFFSLALIISQSQKNNTLNKRDHI